MHQRVTLLDHPSEASSRVIRGPPSNSLGSLKPAAEVLIRAPPRRENIISAFRGSEQEYDNHGTTHAVDFRLATLWSDEPSSTSFLLHVVHQRHVLIGMPICLDEQALPSCRLLHTCQHSSESQENFVYDFATPYAAE